MDKQDLQQVIGDNLYRICAGLKLTREQISERVGVSTNFYANLESGKKMMGFERVQKKFEKTKKPRPVTKPRTIIC